MSGSARQFTYMDLDDFEDILADKPHDERWELIGGRLVKAMVGARWEHHRIIQNIGFALRSHFRGSGAPCRVFTETFWLKQRFMNLGVFPDVMVHCGTLEVGATSLSDPKVLVEVYGPGSEARDRAEKRPLYFKLPSLDHYVLVHRDRVHVEIHDRATGWAYRERERLDDVLDLPAIGFEMTLAEVYEDVIAAQ